MKRQKTYLDIIFFGNEHRCEICAICENTKERNNCPLFRRDKKMKIDYSKLMIVVILGLLVVMTYLKIRG